jgi:hypothetical protein
MADVGLVHGLRIEGTEHREVKVVKRCFQATIFPVGRSPPPGRRGRQVKAVVLEIVAPGPDDCTGLPTARATSASVRSPRPGSVEPSAVSVT